MSGRQVISPQGYGGGGEETAAHYAVPKAEGDGAVQAWIDLLPEWQTAHARRVDAVVTRHAPNVHSAIKWHGANRLR